MRFEFINETDGRVSNMIRTKQELTYYIECDQRALGIRKPGFKQKVKALICPQIWKFEYLLRMCEYYTNLENKTLFQKVLKGLYSLRYERLGVKLGYTVPVNVFGPGLALCHVGTVVVNRYARFGSNARIHIGVNIGTEAGLDEQGHFDNTKSPRFGDNVYIGPGAKVYGMITVGSDVAIGANAVVNKDVPNHVTVAGVPARVISQKGSVGLFEHGDLTK